MNIRDIMDKMKVVMNVAESLCKINGWKIERLDIQHYSHMDGMIQGYTGYMYINGKCIIIRGDGTFEYR